MKQCLKLQDLSLEQKLGMVLTVRNIAFSEEDSEFVMEMIKKRAVGAVQISATPETADIQIARVSEAADYPILIGVDMERGCPLDNYLIPCNMALGALDSADDVYNFARITATAAKKHGYNMVWSPVVDSVSGDCPCKICRTFGDNADKIAEFGTVYMRAFCDCGLIGAAKHYPSPDDGNKDTHMVTNYSKLTKDELLNHSLLPYRKMIDALGNDMTGVMVGHNHIPSIDPVYPSTLSKPIIDILKNELHFGGMTITDSFAMIGLIQNFGNDKILGLAIRAGNDLILPNYRISFRQSYEYLLRNFRDGMFSMERLDDAVSKVLAAQKRTLKQPPSFDLTDEDRRLLNRICNDCICEYRDDGIVPALDRNKKHLFVIDKENQYLNGNEQILQEITTTNWWKPKHIEAKLRTIYPDCEVVSICEFPSVSQVERVCSMSVSFDDVVYFTFCDSRCYQGTDGLTERFRALIEATAVKNAAVVHFGNPYAMEKLIHIPRIIFGFQHPICMDSAIDVLVGEKQAIGHLPLKLQLS